MPARRYRALHSQLSSLCLQDCMRSRRRSFIPSACITKNRIAGFEMASRETLNSSLIHPRVVFRSTLLTNPHAIILAHNHPSGETVSSNADKRVTEIRVEAGNLMEEVLNQVILGCAGRYFSLKEKGLMSNLFY